MERIFGCDGFGFMVECIYIDYDWTGAFICGYFANGCDARDFGYFVCGGDIRGAWLYSQISLAKVWARRGQCQKTQKKIFLGRRIAPSPNALQLRSDTVYLVSLLYSL